MRHYTEEQIAFLQNNIHGRTWKSLGKIFNAEFGTDVPWQSLRYFAVKMGVESSIRGYSDIELEWLKTHVEEYTYPELCKEFNATFHKNRSLSALRQYCLKMGWLAKGSDNEQLTRRFIKNYTDEQRIFLEQNCETNTWDSLANEFNKKFNTNKTRTAIRHFCQSHSLKAQHIEREYPAISAHDSLVHRDKNHFKQRYCRYVYEQETGEKLLPTDRLVFLDGNKRNITASNMAKLPKEEFGWFQGLRLSDDARKNPKIMKAAIEYCRLRGSIARLANNSQ